MKIVDEEQIETLHLYVIPEDDLSPDVPPKPDYLACIITTLCFLCLIGQLASTLFFPVPNHDISFSLTINGFPLQPVIKTAKVKVTATGMGHSNATYASGTITFYNGAIYTQIIPFGTILKGADGIAVVTDTQAIIPSATQTTPPTYGYTSVPAHALSPGTAGNIAAGDINMACCVTSVIAQNPSAFTEGKNARDYTYLTRADVATALSTVSSLQNQTIALFRTPAVLNPTCSSVSISYPAIGKVTRTAVVTVTETCQAISYSMTTVKDAITAYAKRFGRGRLTNVDYTIVGVMRSQIKLYITAQWYPFVVRYISSTGK